MADRQKVLIAHKRVPLSKILHKRSVPEAIEELKKFRAQFAEWEVLYRAETELTYAQGECMLYLYRPENDKELRERLELERAKREEKLERARKKELREKAKAEQAVKDAEKAAELQRKIDLATIKSLSKKLGLSATELSDLGLTK